LELAVEPDVPELEEDVPPGPVSLVENAQDARTSKKGTRRRTVKPPAKGTNIVASGSDERGGNSWPT